MGKENPRATKQVPGLITMDGGTYRATLFWVRSRDANGVAENVTRITTDEQVQQAGEEIIMAYVPVHFLIGGR